MTEFLQYHKVLCVVVFVHLKLVLFLLFHGCFFVSVILIQRIYKDLLQFTLFWHLLYWILLKIHLFIFLEEFDLVFRCELNIFIFSHPSLFKVTFLNMFQQMLYHLITLLIQYRSIILFIFFVFVL
jgi:hypothetical protein